MDDESKLRRSGLMPGKAGHLISSETAVVRARQETWRVNESETEKRLQKKVLYWT